MFRQRTTAPAQRAPENGRSSLRVSHGRARAGGEAAAGYLLPLLPLRHSHIAMGSSYAIGSPTCVVSALIATASREDDGEAVPDAVALRRGPAPPEGAEARQPRGRGRD